MAALLHCLFDLLVTPLRIPAPPQESEHHESPPALRRGTSPMPPSPLSADGDASTTTKPAYVEEPFLMQLRKSTVAALLFMSCCLVPQIPGIALGRAVWETGDDGSDASYAVSAGYAVVLVVWVATYVRVWRTKQVTDYVIDWFILGSFAGELLINVGALNYIPYPMEWFVIVTMAILLRSPRVGAYTVLYMALAAWKSYNILADFMDWKLLMMKPHKDTLFDRVSRVSGPLFSTGLVVAAVFVQSRESVRQLDAAVLAQRVAASVAERLGAYDTAGALEALENRGRVQRKLTRRKSVGDSGAHSQPQTDTCSREPSYRSATRESQGDDVPSQPDDDDLPGDIDPDLKAAFQRLLTNLDSYRPYLPNWLLQSSESSSDDEIDGQQRAVDDVPTTATPHASPSNTPPASTEILYRDSVAVASPGPQPCTTAVVKRATFAMLDFWLEPGHAPHAEEDAAVAELIELVLRAAGQTKAAVHYCALGQVLLSWNVCRSDAACEAKAAKFMAELQAALELPAPGATAGSAGLGMLRVAAAVASGPVRSGEFGVRQRLRVEHAPQLRVRLHGMLRLARQVMAEAPEAATQQQLAQPLPVPSLQGTPLTSAALDCPSHPLVLHGSGDMSGVESARAARPAMVVLLDSASQAAAKHTAHVSFGGLLDLRLCTDGAASWPASAPQRVVPVFELAGDRRATDDEWLYNMAEGPADAVRDALAAAAVSSAATAGADIVATPAVPTAGGLGPFGVARFTAAPLEQAVAAKCAEAVARARAMPGGDAVLGRPMTSIVAQALQQQQILTFSV